MSTLLLAFFKKHITAFVLIASILAICAFIYMKGWSDRGEKERNAAETLTIKRTDNRGKLNEKVQDMDAAAICNAIGGLYRNNKCQ